MEHFWVAFLACLLAAALGLLAVSVRRGARLRLRRRELEEELERQKRSTQAGQERQKDLVAFLAHDLKTPLTSVVGYLTILDSRPDLSAEERCRFTGVALNKAQRLEKLLEEFFDISRMELRAEEERREEVGLSLLLEQLSDEFYPLLSGKDLTLETDIQPRLVTVGDPDKLARVFDNLLRNAVSYSPPGGRIRLTATGDATGVRVRMENQGQGIPEGELSNIFQRFYRLDAARSSATGGAGLGLAIAKEIVESHGGTIAAESTGETVIFQVTLGGKKMSK